MYTRLLVAASGLVALTSAALHPAAAQDAPLVSTDERSCVETNVARAVTTTGLDPLVPDRYTLTAVSPTASRLIVITYTCEAIEVDGALPQESPAGPTTVTIGLAAVSHRDGEPLPTLEQFYVVWWGTDDHELFANLRQAGLPAKYLPRTTATYDPASGSATWTIRGAGLDYHQRATSPSADTDGLSDSTVGFWHGGPQADLRVAVDNSQLESTTAVLDADFSANEILSEIIAQPRLLTITNTRFTYVRGSWTSTVTTVPAPTH